jgi:hypothetical protein
MRHRSEDDAEWHQGEGEGEWNARKQGGSKRRVWRTIHIGIDDRTLEAGAVFLSPCLDASSRRCHERRLCRRRGHLKKSHG